MEFIIDTVDLEEIRDAVDHLPIVGVTSNPSIVKKTISLLSSQKKWLAQKYPRLWQAKLVLR